MIALVQRVSQASVTVDGDEVARVGKGVLALIGVRPVDELASAMKLLERILKYRLFSDDTGKMNLDLTMISGGLLLVPQFTLAADTRHGLRPGFSTAASPQIARPLFEAMVAAARERHTDVASGVFGADMRVALVNEGPVTFWLES
jgi:D-tyrosyl-tRNA(Tyr) deacylase